MLNLFRHATLDLAGLGEQLRQLADPPEADAGTPPTRLVEVTDLPLTAGNLRMLAYVPADLPRRAPLVVVLHGCTQTAAAYDHGTGWSALADRHGFALLYPEQKRVNHPYCCFDWYAAARSGARPRRGAVDPADDRPHAGHAPSRSRRGSTSPACRRAAP